MMFLLPHQPKKLTTISGNIGRRAKGIKKDVFGCYELEHTCKDGSKRFGQKSLFLLTGTNRGIYLNLLESAEILMKE